MQINWITVSAQIVNFLLLIWLLKRFLYQPVLRAMRRREQRILQQLEQARARERDAESEAEQFRHRSRSLEEAREEIMAEARREGEILREQMLEEVRAEVTGMRAEWQQQVNLEKKEFLDQLRRATAQVGTEAARRILREVADAELEERVVQRFIERLRALDAATRRQLASGARTAVLASAFELQAAGRARLTRAVHEHLSPEIDVTYELAPELLCGILLTSGGRQLGWNLAEYMDELVLRVQENFETLTPAQEER